MKCRCLDASSLRTAAFVFILHLGGYWTINGLDRSGRLVAPTFGDLMVTIYPQDLVDIDKMAEKNLVDIDKSRK